MSGLLLVTQGAVSQGVLWGIMVLGVYITYKLLDIPDLTADGSFTLGGCVCTVAILSGVDPILATVMGLFAGLLAGAVTGILHTVFEIPAILAGILTQIGLWSVNLRIMGGKSNNPLLKSDSTISFFVDNFGVSQSQAALIVGIILVLIVIAVLYWFFGTEIGAALRATGDNADMIRDKAYSSFPLKRTYRPFGSNGCSDAEVRRYKHGKRSHSYRPCRHSYRRGFDEQSKELRIKALLGCSRSYHLLPYKGLRYTART